MYRDYKIEKVCEKVISEHYFDTAQEAIREAEIMWSEISRFDRKTDSVAAYRVEIDETIDDEVFEHLYEIWSSEFEVRVPIDCRNATSAMLHTIRDGIGATLHFGDGADEPMPELEHIIRLARKEAAEHPRKVSVEFFEGFEDDEGNFDCRSLGWYEVD